MLQLGRIFRFLALAIAAIAATGCQQSLEVPDRIVLVTIDTLRADHVGFEGYPLPITPFMDSLAERGVVFGQAMAQAPTTGPSHASIFTGLYPIQHRVQANGQKLDEVFLTLAEALSEGGYRTAAFVSTNAHFKWGALGQGFDVYDEQPLIGDDGVKRRRSAYRPAQGTVDAAIDWLAGQDPNEKLFLWIHVYDPHKPLQPPAEYLKQVQQLSNEIGVEVLKDYLRAAHGNPDRRRMFKDIQRYDAEILYVDRQLQRLYEALDRPRSRDLWIVTSDHGQGLNSHDGWMGHARQIYEVQMRVPLFFFSTRGGLSPGRIEDSLVEHVDLVPTIADLANLQFEQKLGEVQGVSLVPHLTRKTSRNTKGFSLAQNSWYRRWKKGRANQSRPKLSLRTLESKYISNEGEEDEFYDLRVDPNERNNLIHSSEHAAERDRMKNSLLRLVESLENLEIDPESVDDETLERLKALGYLQ